MGMVKGKPLKTKGRVGESAGSRKRSKLQRLWPGSDGVLRDLSILAGSPNDLRSCVFFENRTNLVASRTATHVFDLFVYGVMKERESLYVVLDYRVGGATHKSVKALLKRNQVGVLYVTLHCGQKPGEEHYEHIAV